MQDESYVAPPEFAGGPLAEPNLGGVHSLVVHLAGDGRYSVGAYVFDRATHRFAWHPAEGSGDA